MKKKVINVTYRKDSETFPNWMKYEVTLLNEDGTQETIPAYGKDLQDALSRVVHDDRVVQVSKVVNKIPIAVWVFTWLVAMTASTILIMERQKEFGDWVGLVYIVAMMLITFTTLSISNWFNLRNKDKE